MKARRAALLTITIAGTLVAGCTTDGPPPRTAAASAGPSASVPAPEDIAEDEVLAALRKTHAATYKFTVTGDLPDKQRVRASGSLDRKAKKLSTSVKITGGEYPSSVQRVVIGNALYDRQRATNVWAHLDLKRVKKDYLHRDMTDPLGLGTFTSAIDSARRTGPGVYQGTFNVTPRDADEFLPVGAPSIVVFGGTANYTVTTDAQGWVTKINVDLDAKEKLKMTTIFSAHGKPQSIKKPKNVIEADDIYYD
jgi:hypothetical protein